MAGVPKPPGPTLRRARLVLRREPAFGRLLKAYSKKESDPALHEAATALAGLALEIDRMLAEASAVGGRRVVDTIFALHALLGGRARGESVDDKAGLLVPLEDWKEWIGALRNADSRWGTVLTRWADVLSERLGMARYPDAVRRPLHAMALFGVPAGLLYAEMSGGSEESWRWPAERLLAFLDLVKSSADAEKGWNRIGPPEAVSMGGFYGLAESPRPSTPEEARAGALAEAKAWGELLQLGAGLEESSGAQSVTQSLGPLIQDALEFFALKGWWPRWIKGRGRWLWSRRR